jgi:DNA excision repair protein ERCC-3
LLRPKKDQPDGSRSTARFYAIVSRDTVDADFAQHRQRFLAEQGYAYRIVDADDVASA